MAIHPPLTLRLEVGVFSPNLDKAHVLYAYKGKKSKTSPYIALSSFENVGAGGENFPEAAYENQKLGDHTYGVIYNEHPYSLVTIKTTGSH